MVTRRIRPVAALAAAIVVAVWSAAAVPRASSDTLPPRLSDEDFWRMVTAFSERAGTFPSDNLLSNETSLQSVIPILADTVKPGGVYLASAPSRISPTSSRCGRGWRSSSTSGAATSRSI